MLKATNPATRRYWNGSEYIEIPLGIVYEPKSEKEREALLKCQGIMEVEPKAPLLPLSKRKQKA